MLRSHPLAAIERPVSDGLGDVLGPDIYIIIYTNIMLLNAGPRGIPDGSKPEESFELPEINRPHRLFAGRGYFRFCYGFCRVGSALSPLDRSINGAASRPALTKRLMDLKDGKRRIGKPSHAGDRDLRWLVDFA
jgi:hypothetical protein